MEFFAPFHGFLTTVKVGNVHVSKVVAFFDKGEVEGWLVAEETGAPDPGISGSGIFWEDEGGFGLRIGEGEVETVVPVPLAGGGGFGGVVGKTGDDSEEESEQDGLHW